MEDIKPEQNPEDGFKELSDNIKTLIEKGEATEKLSKANAAQLLEMQKKAGRSKGVSSSEKTYQQLFSDAIEQNAGELVKFAEKKSERVLIELKAAPSDMLTTSISGLAAATTQVKPGVVAPPPRPFHMIDVLPQTPIGTGSIAYLKETAVNGNFSAVPQGSFKPQVSFSLSEVNSPVQVIAAYLNISQQYLYDVALMQEYVSQRLLELLLVELDNQLINGTGVTPRLGGILLSGNYTAHSGSATIFVAKLVDAIGQQAALNRRSSIILVTPADYYSILSYTASTSGDFTAPQVLTIGADGFLRLAGVPIYWHNAVPTSNYIVGDLTGCNLWMRQSPTLEIFREAYQNVYLNQITLRMEMRCAFTVYSAGAFIAV